MKKFVIIAVVIALVWGLFSLKRGGMGSEYEEAEFTSVSRGDLTISLKESGFLNAVEEITVKNDITFGSLNIIEIIPDGTYVEKGDFIIELDTEPLLKIKAEREDKVITAELNLTQAQNTYEITESEVQSGVNSSRNKIEFAKLDLEKFETLDKERQLEESLGEIDVAKDQLSLSEQGYKTSVELAEKGFETKSRVASDELDLSAKRRNLKSSMAKYETLKNYDLKKESLQLVKSLEEARSDYERTQKEGDNKIQGAKAKLDNAQNVLQRAQDELVDVESQLKKTRLNAPISGYALYPKVKYYQIDKQLSKGKSVGRNQALMRLPNMERLKVDVDVAERFVSDIKVGQKAIISVGALKDRTFSGVVSYLSPLPVQESSWNKSSVQKYHVIIDVEDDTLPATIKPQISAATEIILDELSDVVYVPIQAVHTVKGKRVVYVRKGSGYEYETREVSIGKMNTSYIEISEGVKEGEEVLISEPESV